jgi:hypothetical protein
MKNKMDCEYHLLFSKSGPTTIKVKFKDFNGFMPNSTMEPIEIIKLVSADKESFIRNMTFDEWPFEVYKYEIDPIKNIVTIHARPIQS